MGILSNLFNFFIIVLFVAFISLCKYYNKDKNNFSIPNFFKDEIIFILESKKLENVTIGEIKDYFDNKTYILNVLNFNSNKFYFDNLDVKYKLNGTKTNININNLKVFNFLNNQSSNDFNNFNEFNINDIKNLSFNIDKVSIQDKDIDLYLDNISLKNNVLITRTKSIIAKAEIENDIIDINIKGRYKDIYDLTISLGYYEYIDYLNKDWIINNDIELNIQIDINAKKLKKIKILFKNNDINFIDIDNLKIRNVNGFIMVDNDEVYSLYGEFDGILFDEAIHSKIINDSSGVKITSRGNANIDKLNKWLNIDILNFVHGTNIVDFELFLSKNKNIFSLKSNLFEIHSDLPEPFYKDSRKEFPINLTYNIDDDNLNIIIENHELKISKNGFIINLNGSKETTNKKFGIFGKISNLNTKKILALFENQASNNTKIKEIVFNSDINLTIDNVIHNGEEYGDFNLLSTINSSEDVMFTINSKNLEGNFLISKDLSYIGNIKKLHLDIGKSNNINVDLHDFKNGKLKVENLYINNSRFYDLNINIPKDEENILNIQITSNAEDYFIGGTILHSKIDGLTRFTSLEENLIAGSDIYSLNKWNNKESPLTTEEFFIKTNLYWTGQPLDFNKESLRGTLEINLNNIVLKGVAEDYSKMKVLNIFNFDNLFKFFMFDFKNISNKELYFDNFNLNARVSEGTIYLDNLNFKGDDAKIKGSGNIDILNETIDTKIKIQIPVTNKMPVLTLLAGASPQTAGIIFLADKIFGEKIDKAFDVDISLKGDLSDIKVDKK